MSSFPTTTQGIMLGNRMSQPSRKRKADCEADYPRLTKAAKQTKAATLPDEVLSTILQHFTPENQIRRLGTYSGENHPAHELPSTSVLRVNKHWRGQAKAYFAQNRQDILSVFYCRSGKRTNRLLDARNSFHKFAVRPVAQDVIFGSQYKEIIFDVQYTRPTRPTPCLHIEVHGIPIPGAMLMKKPMDKNAILLVKAVNNEDPGNDDSYTNLEYCETYTPQQIGNLVARIYLKYFNPSQKEIGKLSDEGRQSLKRKAAALKHVLLMIKQGIKDRAELGEEAEGMEAMDMRECWEWHPRGESEEERAIVTRRWEDLPAGPETEKEIPEACNNYYESDD